VRIVFTHLPTGESVGRHERRGSFLA
jgi:hypothetical protein